MKNTSGNYSLGLSAYRVFIGILILKNSIFYLPMAEQLFGGDAIVPIEFFWINLTSYNLSFLAYPFELQYAPQLYLITLIVLSSLFIFAIGKRFVGAILFIGILVLGYRNNLVLDGSDNVIMVTMPFLLISNAFNHLTLTINRQYINFSNLIPDVIIKNILMIGHYGIMIQICIVYFFTALHKLQGEVWLNGTAVYYTMRVNEFRATDYNILLTKNHYFVVLSTYFTVFWELSFAFLVWGKYSKYIILFLGVILHLGIWIFMRIDNFSWVLIASYFVFISNKDYFKILRFITKINNSIINTLNSKFIISNETNKDK
ncbi:hypothetical protein P872_19495 [Rhodonellum psychrophilum GCM71 = DSM 17998]|uniref:HTTM-like domain-containing protein n=2 Tax=Rhodonellum TaxID=336827 RepID=U5BUW6_9BACT|nr:MULTISPECIES: HTTM domain-containing protein [Rhodonellum]ERM81683.1 hypothetical protein P872_19495 [Rhodonellum psychrophilum GCM71 = DSM 17998]SDY83160.1 Vitamin K-dependent gamma-carboxylase [Rhodonellum ikkaensis]